MKHFLTGILFCVLALGGFAQDEYVDSLKNELAKTDDDLEKAEIYDLLFEYYYYSQIDNNIAYCYADTFLLYSEKCQLSGLRAYAYYCKGLAKYSIGDYAASAKYYESAEKIAEGRDYERLSWRISFGLGEICRENKNYKQAIYYFNDALEHMKAIDDYESYAAVLVNIAYLYYKENDYYTSSLLYDSALNITSLPSTIIEIYGNKAELEYSIGNVEKAKEICSKILPMLNDSIDTYTSAYAFNNISSIYIQDGDYNKAFMCLEKIDSIDNLSSFGNIRLTFYKNYHDLYMKVGDSDKANRYLEQYSMLSDSMYNTELTKMLIEHRNEEISLHKTLNLILFFIIAIVLIFITIVAFLLVKKNRMNKMLAKLNADLKQRDEEISSNLDYAREIQLGCMSNSLTESNLQMFILDRPKVVVGGDFYISQTKGDASYVVVGDCTGHGISGGFLSVLGIKSVYAAIEKYDTLPEMASFINNEFCEIVSSAENLKGESLCLSMLRICGNEVRFLGSKQKMWIVSVVGSGCSTVSQLACKPEVREYKSSNAIMGSVVNEEFAEEIINVNSGDVVFLSSDGYPDQFGAEGKLKYSRFRALLQECSQMEPDKAKEFLSEKLDSWRGDLEQTDDVMVVGMYF
ncbi:MAG: tetratricopeptide repeat protein [Bacteroidales bacterium]|nr:tetratricopeptide repeat protein [Bacteroidales bacterium]